MTDTRRPRFSTPRLGLLVPLGGLIVFAAIAVWAIAFVPMNMDEALYYHDLACRSHAASHLNTFREACDHRHDLWLFSWLSLPLSYPYIGVTTAFLYAPFFYLFHHAAAQYVFNLLFLFLFAWQVTALSRAPRRFLPLVMAFFPFAVSFLHDTGPIKIPFLVFTTLGLLASTLYRQGKPAQAGLGLLAAYLICVAMYDKIYFVFLLPSLFLFVAAFLSGKDDEWRTWATTLKNTWLAVLLAVALACAGLGLLLLATGANGQTYLARLQGLDDAQSHQLGPLLLFLFDYLTFWPAYAYRFLAPDGFADLKNVLFSCASLAFIALGLASGHRAFRGYRKPRFVFLAASFAAMVGTFLVFRNVWASHHFVFLWIPLTVLFLDFLADLKGPRFWTMIAFYLALNLACCLALTPLAGPHDAGPDRQAVFDYFTDEQQAPHTLVVYASWGGYFLHTLYAPEQQLVTYAQPLDEREARRLFKLAHQTNRTLYIVCLRNDAVPVPTPSPHLEALCESFYLNRIFGNRLRFRDVLPGRPHWRVFEGFNPKEPDSSRFLSSAAPVNGLPVGRRSQK